MYSINKTLIYFLVFTAVSSFVAYRLVMASYESYDYDMTDQLLQENDQKDSK